VYAMRVDDKITRLEYYHKPRFAKKKRRGAGYEGDNIRPTTLFEKKCQFVLISRHFWYFGRNAISIPKNKFPYLEKTGPGYRSDFEEAYILRFKNWLETETGCKPGICGDPCKEPKVSARRKGNQVCKSYC
jgi:hypothetical protein